MKIETLLGLLDSVRRSGNGWLARCPGHADLRPSLSIHEGERGILLKCWAGCDLKNICSALGIQIGELFYESQGNTQRRFSHEGVVSAESFRVDWKGYGHQIQWYADEFFLRGKKIFAMARKFHPSAATEEEFDRALEAVHSGYVDFEESEKLMDLCVNLRDLGIQEERTEHANIR